MTKLQKLGIVLGAVAAIVSPFAASAATLFTAPTATSTFDAAAVWSTEAFDSFLPIVYILAGAIIGALLVLVVLRALLKAAYKVLGGGRGGRGRRGRR